MSDNLHYLPPPGLLLNEAFFIFYIHFSSVNGLDMLVWGTFDQRHSSVDFHPRRLPGDIDLLDLVDVETILKGRLAYPLDLKGMPEKDPAEAVFHY